MYQIHLYDMCQFTTYQNEWDNIQDSSLYNVIADIFITLKAHMSQQEREKTVCRINQGLEAAKDKGKQIGRPKAELTSEFLKEYEKFKNGYYGRCQLKDLLRYYG